MILFGKLGFYILEKTFGHLQTNEVIVTENRLKHIQERHPEDFALFMEYWESCVQEPDYIVKDQKNDETVFMIKKLETSNLNLVLRLALAKNPQGYKNAVITCYRIRESNLKKLLEKNLTLYKGEDFRYL